MGKDKSLTDDFPSVMIGGEKYHYGKETIYGQYLVEHFEDGKRAWGFDIEEDLIAFLVMLPESADSSWFRKKYPDWSNVSPEIRSARIAERHLEIRRLAQEKQRAVDCKYYNVMQFDESGYYFAPAEQSESCHSVFVRSCECEQPDGQKEWLITLHKGNEYVTDGPPLVFSKNQALKVASGLILAVEHLTKHAKSSK